jgi:hypothetical protein
MTVYGIGGSLFGLFYLVFPEQSSVMQSGEAASAFLVATKMALGASLLAVGIFVAAAARDPIKNILWARFAIAFALSFLAVALYSGAVLFASFSQALLGETIHGLFAALLIAFYPWGWRRRDRGLSPSFQGRAGSHTGPGE